MQKQKKTPPNFRVGINEKLLTKSYPIQNSPRAYFPFQPYPEQSELICLIQKTISSSQNAIIQSPTGTGKTICLLVGSLSALNTIHNPKSKIFYLTRTHSQISQVINELKKTLYIAKVNIIASRDHLCVNPNTKQLKGRMLQKVCNNMVHQKTCLFQESDNRKVFVSKREILQLEDFKQNCRKELVCPFFYSKQLTQKTQLTILPFNYFLDWKIFQSFSHLIKDSVIIFDEAHNVDSIAQDGSCLEIDCRMLGYAINELKGLEKKFKFESQANRKNKCEILLVWMILQRLKNSIQQTKRRIFCSKSELQQFIASSTTVTDPQNDSQSIEGLDLSDSMSFFQNLHQVTKLFYKKQAQPVSFLAIINNLQKMCTLWKQRTFEKNFITKITSDQDEKSFSLRLKCLSPSVGFHKLLQNNPRSIILSSGTMGNLQKWQKYLNIQFHQKTKIQSFITKNQLYCSVVGRSQSNYPFEFSYQKKDYENQHRQVAEQLMKIESTIPEGNGIVVAFSTYLLMQKVIRHCNGLKKKVFYESKGSDVTKIFNEYSEEAKINGAFLFIVMKGRFSEGINFSDYLCRCLIVVGMPFLPRKQLSIQQKMAYIKQTYTHQEAEEWYKEQSFQSVNQTIGRVIRNKKDYGVILLFDQRYAKKQNFQLLSGWFRKCVRSGPIQSLYRDISDFFNKKEWLNENNQSYLQKTIELKKQILNQRNESVKTVDKKKRHLKLKFDSSQKKSYQSRDQLTSIDKSETKIKDQSGKKSRFKSYKKKKQQTNNDRQRQFKTPSRQNKYVTRNPEIFLSKINIQKKEKLRGFVNKKIFNFSNTFDSTPSLIIENAEQNNEIELDKYGSVKSTEKKGHKNLKPQVIKTQLEVSPFLQYLMF